MSKLIICIASLFFLASCSFGIVDKINTLQEKPFAVVRMQGNVTEATRCVGRFWQNYATKKGTAWNVYVESYQVMVTGPHLGSGAPPIGLVIDFEEIEGNTVARAHMHHIFSQKDKRRTVTLEALDACRLHSTNANPLH